MFSHNLCVLTRSTLVHHYGEHSVRESIRNWLLDDRHETITKWERLRGRIRQRTHVVQSGGALDPDEIVEVSIRRVHSNDGEDGPQDALEVILRLVSARVVDKLRVAAIPIVLRFDDDQSADDPVVDPHLKRSGMGRPNEEISFSTFKAGLHALRKASPLRFCSSGLLADLYKRLYWDEAAVLDVVKEVFVQKTMKALEEDPNMTHMIIPERDLRILTVNHFRRFKNGTYLEQLLEDQKLQEFFSWYASDMAPHCPELRGRGVVAWSVLFETDIISEVDDVFFDDVHVQQTGDDDEYMVIEDNQPTRAPTLLVTDEEDSSVAALKGRTKSYAEAMEKKAAELEVEVEVNEEDGSEFGEIVLDDDSPSMWQKVKTSWRHYTDWQELSNPHDLYIVELFVDVIMLLMFFPIWGTTAFLSAEQRFDSKLTQGGADSEASGSFVITYTELGLLLRQFAMIVIGRILFARRWTSLKILMHFYRTIELYIVAFFVLPGYTGLTFHQNSFVIWLFFFTTVYLFASGRQIRTGYPTHGYSMDMFTKSSMKIPMFYIWTIYRQIPFMVELKVMWDWVVSPTSLSLIEWFKLEDINAQLHKNRMADLNNTDWTGTTHWYMDGRDELGKPMPNVQKLIYAGIAFVLLVIIWLPLILIPIANANSQPHLPTTVTVRLIIDWDRSTTASGVNDGFVSTPVVIYEASADPIELLPPFDRLRDTMADFDSTGFASLYSRNDVALFAFPSFSPRRWDISPTLKEELTCAIASNLTLSLTYEARFTRDKVSETSAESVGYRTKIDIELFNSTTGLATGVRNDLLDMMKGTSQSTRFTRYYHNGTSLPFALLLGKDSSATEVTSSDLNFVRNQVFFSLYFQPNQTDGTAGKYWWNVAQTLPGPSTGSGITSTCTENSFCVPYSTAVQQQCGASCEETRYLQMYSVFSNSSNEISASMDSCTTGDGALPVGYQHYLYDTGAADNATLLEQQRNRRTYLVTFNKRVAGSLFAFLSSNSGSWHLHGCFRVSY